MTRYIHRRLISLAAASGMLATMLPGAAWAQAPASPATAPGAAAGVEGDGRYKSLTPHDRLFGDKNKAAERSVYGRVRAILKTTPASLNSGNQVMFDAYYRNYLFPVMTLTTPERLEALPKERERFLRDHLGYCETPEVHQHLLNLTVATLLPVVQDEGFHPAVRYNALIVLGALNSQEAVRVGGNKSTVVPYAPGFTILLGELKNPKNNDALKVAALIGIVRHLEWDNFIDAGTQIPPAQRADLLKELTTLAEKKEPPAGRTLAGHNWMRRRAVEALALSGAKKTEAAVAATIDKILADDTDALMVRCAAASAMGRMTYLPPLKLDPLDAAKKLGYLALVVCDTELNRLAELKKKEESRMNPSSGAPGMEGMAGGFSPYSTPGMAGGEGMGMGMGMGMLPQDPKGYRRDPICRRIRAQLFDVQVGFHGVESLLGTKPPANPVGAILGVTNYAKAPAEQTYTKEVLAAVETLIKIVEAEGTDMASIEKDLRRAMPPLEAITKKLGPAPKPVEDVPTELPAAAAAPADAPPAAAPVGPAPADVPGADVPATDVPAPAPAATPAPMPAAPAAEAGAVAPPPAAAARPAPAAPAAVNPLDEPPK